MNRWIQSGQFSLELPSNWSISQQDKFTEFTPQSADAALHVSTFLRTQPAAASRDEAAKMIEDFARQNRLKAKVKPVSEEADGAVSCMAHFFSDESNQDALQWVVRSVVGRGNAVIASLCSGYAISRSYREGLAT